jgi:hypothetical protein
MSEQKPITHFDQLYPGRFLKAGLFAGKSPTLTISGARTEKLEGDQGPQVKAILSFAETEMDLVMCKTNGLCIKAMFGPDIENWIAKKVTFCVGKWKGEDCIRVAGSPDIDRIIPVEIKLPKRKPVTMEMKPTGKATS